jgi:hypothetical protein
MTFFIRITVSSIIFRTINIFSRFLRVSRVEMTDQMGVCIVAHSATQTHTTNLSFRGTCSEKSLEIQSYGDLLLVNTSNSLYKHESK